MGAWDADPFGKDDAADWDAEFELLDRTAGLQVLDAVFVAANQADYREAASADGTALSIRKTIEKDTPVAPRCARPGRELPGQAERELGVELVMDQFVDATAGRQ